MSAESQLLQVSKPAAGNESDGKADYEKHLAALVSEHGVSIKYDQYGYCPNHPDIQLRKKKGVLRRWKTVMDHCPRCKTAWVAEREPEPGARAIEPPQQDYAPRTPKERSGEERQVRHSSHQRETRSQKSGEGRSRERDGMDQLSAEFVSFSAGQSTGAPVAKHRGGRKSATPPAAGPSSYQPPPAVSSLVKTARPVVKLAPPSTASISYSAAQSTGAPVVKHGERKSAPPPAVKPSYQPPPAVSSFLKTAPPRGKRENSPHKPPPEPKAETVVVIDPPTKKLHVKRREKRYADYDRFLSNKGMKISDIPQPDSKSGKPFSELYSLKGVLGTGAFSTVREGSHVSNPKVTYAVKCVNRPKLSEKDEAALLDEVSILKEMNHIHIIRLYDFFTTPSTYYLVMERMSGGELFDRIVAKAYYNEKEARDTCKILLEAVCYCHDNHVAHRDLKPENLLLRSEEDDSAVKIADFGFAKKVREPRSLTTKCGTPGYVAPEILEGVPYDTKSDMWSVGVILYILLGGYPPFIENNQRDLFRKICKGEYEFHDEYWSQVSSGAKDLISSLLTVDPDVRLDAQQALDNAWIRQDDESLEKKDLGVNLQEFKKFNAKRKFRAAVSSVLAVNKLQSLGKDFLGSLQDSGESDANNDSSDTKKKSSQGEMDDGGTFAILRQGLENRGVEQAAASTDAVDRLKLHSDFQSNDSNNNRTAPEVAIEDSNLEVFHNASNAGDNVASASIKPESRGLAPNNYSPPGFAEESKTATSDKHLMYIAVMDGNDHLIVVDDVEQSDTLLDVKKIIFDLVGIPTDQQELSFNGQPLGEDILIENCGIKEGGMQIKQGSKTTEIENVLNLRNTETGADIDPIDITVKSLIDGTRIDLEVSLLDAIFDVKKQIESKQGIPVEQQHICFKDEELDDWRSLSSYNIVNSGVLELVIHLQGGANSAGDQASGGQAQQFQFKGSYIQQGSTSIDRKVTSRNVMLGAEQLARFVQAKILGVGVTSDNAAIINLANATKRSLCLLGNSHTLPEDESCVIYDVPTSTLVALKLSTSSEKLERRWFRLAKKYELCAYGNFYLMQARDGDDTAATCLDKLSSKPPREALELLAARLGTAGMSKELKTINGHDAVRATSNATNDDDSSFPKRATAEVIFETKLPRGDEVEHFQAPHVRNQNVSQPHGVLTVFQAEPLAYRDLNGNVHALGWLNLDSEKESLKEAVGGTNIEVEFEPATPDVLGRFLAKGNKILHLSCHGNADYVAIEDGWGGLQQLLLEDFTSWIKAGRNKLCFVFVSACDSRNVGNALVKAQVPHVICCQGQGEDLNNQAAREFARSLYGALAQGNTLLVAFNLAKEAVKHTGIENAPNEILKFALLPELGDHDVNIFAAPSIRPRQAHVERPCCSGVPHCTRLVGRDVDMFLVLRKLIESRLVRVTGPPGIGKGSFAMAVGHYLDRRKTWGDTFWLPRLQESFSAPLYGQLYFELRRRSGEQLPLSGKPVEKEHREIVLGQLDDKKSLIIVDAREATDRDTQILGIFLHDLLQNTSKVKVLVIHPQGKAVYSPNPYGYPGFESDYILKPLDFWDTAHLFARGSQYVTCHPDKLAEELEPHCSPELFKLLGGGIPAKTLIAAKNMTPDEYHRLMDKKFAVNLREFGKCLDLQAKYDTLKTVGAV